MIAHDKHFLKECHNMNGLCWIRWPCQLGTNKSRFVSTLINLCDASPLWYFLPQTDGLRALQLPAKRWRPQICDCTCYTKWVLFLICLIFVDIFHGVESFDNFESLATSIFIGKCKYFVPMQLLPCELVTAISHFISFNWKCDQRKREPFVLTPRGGNQTGERKSKTPITSFQSKPEQIWS